MKQKFYLNSFLLKLTIGVLLLTGFDIHTVQAQTDTVFWFAAPEISIAWLAYPPGDRPIVLRITSEGQSAHVTISQPAGGMPSQLLTIPANSTQTIDLTTWLDDIESKPPNAVLNTGLKISSDAPITAYYQDVSGGTTGTILNPEVFTLKGHSALGTDFWIPTQNILSNDSVRFNPQPYSSFVIVATEDNTSITINPAKAIVGHLANQPFTINLNKGQTYSATAAGQSPQAHLSGSHVSSTKPIAITVSDDDVLFFQNCGSDICGDQIVPKNNLGTKYAVVKGLSNPPGDYVFIVATTDNTTIKENGTAIGTINAGETKQVLLNSNAAYFESSQPVAVWHLSGVGCQTGQSIVPKLECNGSRKVVYTRSVPGDFLLNIVVAAGGESGFSINGNTSLLTAAQFSDVPGTNSTWRYCRLQLNANNFPVGTIINISNSLANFQLGVIEGTNQGSGQGASLSYFSNYNSRIQANVTAQPNPACVGDDIQLAADSFSGASYLWQGPNGFSSNIHNPLLADVGLEDAGTYTLNVDNGGAGCSSSGTVTVQINSLPVVDLGNDTSVCVGTVLTLQNKQDYPAALYTWSNGATSHSIIVRDSGTYTLTITNPPHCKGTDAIHLDVHNCDCVSHIPNAFSPNGDGINDIFNPAQEISCALENYLLRIYNRYGQLIFTSTSPSIGWDGTYNHKKADLDTYYFYITYKEFSTGIKKKYKGDLTLIR